MTPSFCAFRIWLRTLRSIDVNSSSDACRQRQPRAHFVRAAGQRWQVAVDVAQLNAVGAELASQIARAGGERRGCFCVPRDHSSIVGKRQRHDRAAENQGFDERERQDADDVTAPPRGWKRALVTEDAGEDVAPRPEVLDGSLVLREKRVPLRLAESSVISSGAAAPRSLSLVATAVLDPWPRRRHASAATLSRRPPRPTSTGAAM